MKSVETNLTGNIMESSVVMDAVASSREAFVKRFPIDASVSADIILLIYC